MVIFGVWSSFFQGEEGTQARPLHRKGFSGKSAIGLPSMGGLKDKAVLPWDTKFNVNREQTTGHK